jgi:hypothetical protein
MIDPVQSFPPTFRNPGNLAPIRAITVHNTGEATLNIASVMMSDEPVWQLVDSGSVNIPGGGAHDFQVKFSPTTVGPAPTGVLTLVNNDNDRPTTTVTLNGTGVARNVAFGPPVIDLGHVFVGGKVSSADLLAVSNLDPAASFTIQEISLTDDTMFHIENRPWGVALPALSAQHLVLSFEPIAEGHFATTAALFLDDDPEQQAVVHITGEASGSVSIHGGGCSAGGGAGGGAGLALAAILRRRRRAGTGVLAATALVPVAADARA